MPPSDTGTQRQVAPSDHAAAQVEASGNAPDQTRTADAGSNGQSVASQANGHETIKKHSGDDNAAQDKASNDQASSHKHVRSTSQWNQPEAQKVWQAALGDLESMTEAFARMVSRVVAVGTQQLRLEFPANGNLAMKRCELPEHRNTIATAVSQHAGREIILEYFLAEPISEPKKAETSGNKPSRIQRMREIETNELVKSCIEHFNAEIVRIDRVN